jgi:hypothetical protein
MILLSKIVEVLAIPHLNELPLRILLPQKPKGCPEVGRFSGLSRDVASEDVASDDPFLDFVGALIDLAHFRVAIDRLQRPGLS